MISPDAPKVWRGGGGGGMISPDAPKVWVWGGHDITRCMGEGHDMQWFESLSRQTGIVWGKIMKV